MNVERVCFLTMSSNGYPAWADTDGKKREYVANYKAHEGIELNPDMIKENKGRKTTAKLMLNSFWGSLEKTWTNLP